MAPRPSVVTDELARRSHGEVDRPFHRQRHRAANVAARREHEHAPVHPVRDADRPVRRDVVARWAEGLLVSDTADTADLPGPIAVRQLGYDAVARTSNLEIEGARPRDRAQSRRRHDAERGRGAALRELNVASTLDRELHPVGEPVLWDGRAGDHEPEPGAVGDPLDVRPAGGSARQDVNDRREGFARPALDARARQPCREFEVSARVREHARNVQDHRRRGRRTLRRSPGEGRRPCGSADRQAGHQSGHQQAPAAGACAHEPPPPDHGGGEGRRPYLFQGK